MKKILQRLAVFFIGIPLLFSVVFFFSWHNNLCLNLLTLVFSILGAIEFRNILTKKSLYISMPETIILGGISPAAWTVVVSLGVTGQIVAGAFILGASWLLVSSLFVNRKNIDSYMGHTAAGFALIIYPGMFLSWIIQMAVLREAPQVISVYFLVVFLNDAMAWVAGNLFGKNNRGVVAVSPNKSIAGFAGGLAASLLTGIAATILLPGTFSSTVMHSLPAGAFLGLIAGAAATFGDLGESAIKRSAGVKDSGSLILGRGGVLDSIDSLALAAPVFYLLYQILFT